MAAVNREEQDIWRRGVLDVAGELRQRAQKLADWMRTERVESELRLQLSMRAGELFEAARLAEIFAQKPPA